jgi:hypothetical protein
MLAAAARACLTIGCIHSILTHNDDKHCTMTLSLLVSQRKIRELQTISFSLLSRCLAKHLEPN